MDQRDRACDDRCMACICLKFWLCWRRAVALGFRCWWVIEARTLPIFIPFLPLLSLYTAVGVDTVCSWWWPLGVEVARAADWLGLGSVRHRKVSNPTAFHLDGMPLDFCHGRNLGPVIRPERYLLHVGSQVWGVGEACQSKTRSLWLFVTVFSLAIVLAVYMVFILWFLPWLWSCTIFWSNPVSCNLNPSIWPWRASFFSPLP